MKNRGFTLVELIVVIAVLAALSAIALPSMNGIIGNAGDRVCQNNRISVMRTYKAYMAGTGDKNDATTANECLTRAVTEAGGTMTSDNQYTMPQHNAGAKMTVIYGNGNTDYSFIETILCTQHNQETSASLVNSVITIIDKIFNGSFDNPTVQAALKSYFTGQKVRSIDSTTTTGTNINYLKNALSDVDLSKANMNSWSLVSENSGASYKLYWSDVDINTLSPGTTTKVMMYDSKTKTYTAGTITIGSTNLSGSTYNVFNNKNASGSSQTYVDKTSGGSTSYDTVYNQYKGITP